MPELARFRSYQVPELRDPLSNDDYRDMDRIPLDCCRDIIYAVAREVDLLESTVAIWKSERKTNPAADLLPFCLDSVVINTTGRYGDMEQQFDELHAFEDVLYATAVKIHQLYKDLQTRFANGFIQRCTHLMDELTAEKMVDHLAFHWKTLLSPDVLATLNFAVRKEKLVAFKTEHNMKTFFTSRKYTQRYTEASITASIRTALDKIPFNERELKDDIKGLQPLDNLNPFALIAHVQQKNSVALAGWAQLAKESLDLKTQLDRRDSFDLDDISDYGQDDSFELARPDVSIAPENIPQCHGLPDADRLDDSIPMYHGLLDADLLDDSIPMYHGLPGLPAILTEENFIPRHDDGSLAPHPFSPVLHLASGGGGGADSPIPAPCRMPDNSTPCVTDCGFTAAQHARDRTRNPGRLERHRRRAALKLEGTLQTNVDMKYWNYVTCACDDACACAYWCTKEPWHMCACQRPAARIDVKAKIEADLDDDALSLASSINDHMWRVWEADCGVRKWW